MKERWRHTIPCGMYIPKVLLLREFLVGDRIAAAALGTVHTAKTIPLKQISCSWIAGVTHSPALGSAVPSMPIPSA